jgi:hypothetical protein
MNEEERSKYTRVTEILDILTFKDRLAIPPEVLSNAADRGTKIHAYCAAILQDAWLPDIELEYEPYVNEFIKWKDENLEKLVSVGSRLYDDNLRFSGEYDFIAILKGDKEPVLIDIKTAAKPSKSWPVQLAAYKHLCDINGLKVSQTYNLHLKKKKLTADVIYSAEFIPYEDSKPFWGIFASALSCYDYFERGAKPQCTNLICQ